MAAFFLLFAFLLILPELLTVLRDVPTGPEQEQMAQEVAQQAAGPRLLWAIGLALGAVGLGAYLEILPGLKRP